MKSISACRRNGLGFDMFKDKEKAKAYIKQWQQSQEGKASKKRYFLKNREKLISDMKVYYKENKDRKAVVAKTWKQRNPDKVKNNRLRFDYGITLEEYNSLAEKQEYLCAICRKPPIRRVLAVDHCHNSDRVRGLLCDLCNMGLGSFKDDLLILESAIKYLKENE